ncbi:MAG TPA: tetratricopeptide repeat protein [Armatimonadota bacterium]|jgi:tetratricopeptide (TPR) repeat protein
MRFHLGLFTGLTLPLLFVCAAAAPCLADASSDLKAGQDLMRAAKYDEAIVLFSSVVASGDSAFAPKGQLCIGIVLQEQKKYPESISALKLGAEKYPTAVGVRREMLYRLGEVYSLTGDTASAIAVYQSIAVQYPSDAANADYRLARTYLGMKKYTEAIDLLKRSIAAHPDAGNTLIESNSLLGQCYRESGDLKNAIALYQTLMAQYPAKADQFGCGLGECLMASGKEYESKKQYDLAIAQYNSIPAFCSALSGQANVVAGICLQSQGKYAEARTAFQKAVDTENAVSNEARLRIDEVLRAEGKYTDEIAYLEKVYVDVPDLRAQSLTRQAEVLSECLGGMNNAKDAIEKLRRVIREFADEPLAVEAQARIAAIQLYNLRDFDASEAGLRGFMAKYPDDPTLIVVAYDLAFCSQLQKNYSVAADLFTDAFKLKEVGNYRAACLYRAAYCYEKAADLENARASAVILIASYPADPLAVLVKSAFADLLGPEGNGGVK